MPKNGSNHVNTYHFTTRGMTEKIDEPINQWIKEEKPRIHTWSHQHVPGDYLYDVVLIEYSPYPKGHAGPVGIGSSATKKLTEPILDTEK